MSEYALPCIICGKELREVFPGHVENQPNDGVVCSSEGNYGSTVWDSLNGEHLEFNICDPCLVEAGAKGRVLAGRNKRPVVVGRSLVGWEQVDRPLVPWHKDLPDYGSDDICYLDEDNLRVELPKTVRLNFTPEELLKQLQEEEA